MLIIVLLLADVIFFSVVFVYFNNSTQSLEKDVKRIRPWIQCLIIHQGDKHKCYEQGQHAFIRESVVTGVLMLLGVSTTEHRFRNT